MSAHRVSLTAYVVAAIWTTAALAGEPELNLKQAHEGSLSPGKAQSFVLALGEGDFAQIRLNPRGQVLVLKTYDPSGKPFRGRESGPQEATLSLVAEAQGAYRVEVAAMDKRASGTFTIALENVVPLAARLAPPKPVVESPRIRALKAAVDSGSRDSVNSFWKEVEMAGAPLIEPIPGDKDNMAVTFLWKGTPWTHNVLVLWLPYAGAAPDEYSMERLGETSVWYRTIKVDRRTRMEYSLAPNAARLHPISFGIDAALINMIAAGAREDPLNPKRWREDPDSVDPSEYHGRSVLEMPDAPPQPWVARRPGVPEGRVERRQFKSAALNNEREVGIYLPPGYSATAEPYPLLVLFDEWAYLGPAGKPALVPTPTILDNLIAEARIPPVVALVIGNAPEARDRELPCNPEFQRVLATELLPWARSQYNFTRDPRLAVVAGSSFGGLAAACAGLWHSETFGNVLAQSGSFHWVPQSAIGGADPGVEPGWVARQFIASPKLPVRFHLDAGTTEIDVTGGGNAILLTTRTLRDVLRAKGYEVYHQEFAGGHDYLGWRGTLADGLIELLGNSACQPPREHSPAQ